jgi:2,4-dienoyl-CoA reductase-like NADH-dependent reductase (Old Yellow Enzyme family)
MNLMTPVRIGAIEAKNRVFMAPLRSCRATVGTDAPNAMIAEYYSQRSSAGLIVSKATQVLPTGALPLTASSSLFAIARTAAQTNTVVA